MNDGGNSHQNRSMIRNDRRYDHRHRETREFSRDINNQRRPMLVDGIGGSDYDDRRPIRRNGNLSGNGYRDSMDNRIDARRESFGQDHEREQYRRRSLNGVMNDFRGNHNESDRHRPRNLAGWERHTNTGIEAGNLRRREYNARGTAYHEQQQPLPNQAEHFSQAPSMASRGDNRNNNVMSKHDDVPRFSNHHDAWDCSTNARNRERNQGILHFDEGGTTFREGRNENGQTAGAVATSGHSKPINGEWDLDRLRDNRERDRGDVLGDLVATDDSRFHFCREGQHHQKFGSGRSDVMAIPSTGPSPLQEYKSSDRVVKSVREDPASESFGRDSCGSMSSMGNSDYNTTNETKKRQLEDHERNKIQLYNTADQEKPTRMEVLPPKRVEKSSLPSSNTFYENPERGSGESKKVKLSSQLSPLLALDSSKTITTPGNRETEIKQWDSRKGANAESTTTTSLPLPSTVPFPTKTHEKPITKNVPVKALSAPSIKKHQIQAKTKPKPKAINKLGIPMRWLKPKIKPKPPVKKIVAPKIPEDTSKSVKIPSKQSSISKKPTSRPSSPSNRLVTDSSEGSSIISCHKNLNKNVSSPSAPLHTKKQKGSSIPVAIVTKNRKQAFKNESKQKLTVLFDESEEDEEEDAWDSQAESEESDSEASESDTDDDEVLDWATKMLGVQKSIPSTQTNEANDSSELNDGNNHFVDETAKTKSPKLKFRLSSALKLKLTESIQLANNKNNLTPEDSIKLEAALKKLERKKKKREKLKALSDKINEERPQFDEERAKMEIEEDRRKREEAKPLTAKQIRKILREDTSSGGDQNNWVRRSRRQPNMARLNSKPVRILVDKLKFNDTDMRVLKMKKYINDPNTPCAVMDAILNAMEENTNCEALYIQNFNEGMRDEHVKHLLRILQQPKCNIWCLNIGENYNVSDKTWELFTKGLCYTKITHMYASEHTITADMKEEIRFTIRENRKKHDMHINPNNLDVIIQCTHCWWNPINSKVLRPFLKKKGYEHVLKDKEAQGLQGSTSMAPTS